MHRPRGFTSARRRRLASDVSRETRRPGYALAVPFMFDLDLPDLTPERGQQIEHAIADSGAWPARYQSEREERRWFGITKAYPHVLELLTEDGRGHILLEPDTWDEERWVLRPDARPRLVATIEIVAAAHPSPFAFRATWSGSPIERDEELTARELAALIATDQLHDHTRYRVWSPASRPTPPPRRPAF